MLGAGVAQDRPPDGGRKFPGQPEHRRAAWLLPRAGACDWRSPRRHHSDRPNSRRIPPCRSSRRRDRLPRLPGFSRAARQMPAACPWISDGSGRVVGSSSARREAAGRAQPRILRTTSHASATVWALLRCSPRRSDAASSFTADRQLGSQEQDFVGRAWAIGKSPSTSCATVSRASSSRPLEMSGRPQHPGRDDVDAAASALQNFHRRDADFGIVMIGEGVVEENNGLLGSGQRVAAGGPFGERVTSPFRAGAGAGPRREVFC